MEGLRALPRLFRGMACRRLHAAAPRSANHFPPKFRLPRVPVPKARECRRMNVGGPTRFDAPVSVVLRPGPWPLADLRACSAGVFPFLPPELRVAGVCWRATLAGSRLEGLAGR